jgi:hypothetical protein
MAFFERRRLSAAAMNADHGVRFEDPNGYTDRADGATVARS